jgi:DNA polymerase V
MLLDLSDDANRQLSLDETPKSEADRQRSQRLMATVDRLNQELRRDTVRLGLPRKNNAWALRCKRRTPRYTTRWGELLKVIS